MKAEYQSVLHLRKETVCNNRYRFLQTFPVIFFILSLLFTTNVLGQSITYTWVGGTSNAWNESANWSSAGGTFPGDGGANDVVIINNNPTFQPTLSTTLNNSIASISIGTGGNITLTITGVTLNVTGTVTILSIAANTARTYGITGTGTLNCTDLNFGSDVATPIGNNSNPTFQLNCTIAALNISGNLTLYANFLNNNRRRNPIFNHTAGTVSIAGSLSTTHENTVNICTYTLGGTSPRLNLSGTTPYSINTNAIAGTNTFTFTTGTSATVEYSSSSNVTIPATPAGVLSYRNLEISGGSGNVKTVSANIPTISGTLTVRAASTLALGNFTLGATTPPIAVVMETVGGGNGAQITGGTGNMTINGPLTVNYTGTGSISSGASITKPILLGTANRTFTINDDGDDATTDLTISSVISSGGAAGGITKAGAGTLELTGANSFDGAVIINAGVLEANTLANAAAVSSLGDGAGTPAITIGGSGTLRYTGSGHSTTRAITLSGSGATIDASGGGTATFSGAMSGAFNLVLTGTGTGIYSAIIGTGAGSVTKNGSGTWTLSSANSYQGGCTMNAGTLNINNASALGTVAGTFTIAGGIIQNTSGGAITTNNHPINITGDFEHAGTQNLNLGTGAVSMATDININTSVSGRILTIGGAINEPTRSLTKSGIGTLNFVSQNISLNALTISAGELLASSGTMNLNGAFTNNATFTNNAGTVVMNAAASSIAGSTTTTFNNLTIAATPTAQSQYNTSFNVANALTVNGSVTFAPTGGTITMNSAASAIVNNGTLTFRGLTIATTPTAQTQYNASYNVAGTFTVNGSVTFAPTGGTITMNNAASTIVNSGTLTFSGLTIATTPTAQSQYNTSFNVANALTVNGSVTFAPTAGTITMNNVASSISNSGTLTFNNLTISATPTSQAQYNTSFSVAGTFATSGAITFAPTGGTITMTGPSGAINNASGTVTFQNLTISGTTVSSTGNFAVAVTMSVSGVFNPAATSIISGAGTITGTGTVNVTRTAATPSFGAQYTITTKTLGNLTVNYNGAGAQTVDAQDYGSLTISTNGTRTVTFVNGGTIRVSNVFTPTATTTTYVVTGNTFEYNGSVAQTVAAFTYNNLILSSSGGKTVLAGTTVNCQTLEINDTAVLTLPDTSVLNVQG